MSCDYVNNLKLRGHVTKTIFAHNLSALHFDLCPHIILELQASFFADRFDHFDGKLLYCFLLPCLCYSITGPSRLAFRRTRQARTPVTGKCFLVHSTSVA